MYMYVYLVKLSRWLFTQETSLFYWIAEFSLVRIYYSRLGKPGGDVFAASDEL